MRYAIYFMPPPHSPLWTFGSSAIGYDAHTRERCALPANPVYDDPRAREWVREPARYGFHATLKAPFEMRAGTCEDDLLIAARAFVATRQAVAVDRLVVSTVSDRFLALTEDQPCPSLAALADDCVRAFEPFRAPLGAADLARRLERPMSDRRRANLDRWGYHLVFEDFRFHMTLTGALDADTLPRLAAALSGLYAAVDPRPLAIDAIAIFRQPSRDGPFHVLERFALL